MALFRKKQKKEEPIPQSLSLLPPQKQFDEEEDEFGEDLDDDEELPEEKELPKPTVEKKEQVSIPLAQKPLVEITDDDIETERQKILDKIKELDKRAADKKEAEEKKRQEQEKVQEQPTTNMQERIIVAIQTLDKRVNDIEAALFRLRSSI